MIKDCVIYLKKTICVVYLNKHLLKIILLFVMCLNKKALLNKFN